MFELILYQPRSLILKICLILEGSVMSGDIMSIHVPVMIFRHNVTCNVTCSFNDIMYSLPDWSIMSHVGDAMLVRDV